MELKYFGRKPNFPVLLNINENIYYAYQDHEIINIFEKYNLDKKDTIDIIDSSNEGWIFHNEIKVISPLTLKKTYTKKELINLFNNRKNKKDTSCDVTYDGLSNRTFNKIFLEIISELKKYFFLNI